MGLRNAFNLEMLLTIECGRKNKTNNVSNNAHEMYDDKKIPPEAFYGINRYKVTNYAEMTLNGSGEGGGGDGGYRPKVRCQKTKHTKITKKRQPTDGRSLSGG